MGVLLAVWLIASLAATDSAAIITRFVEQQAANRKRADQYTYVEHAVYVSFDKGGKSRKNRSETREVMFVEGLPYRKLVAKNEQPLSAGDQAKEDARQRQTAEERRKQRRAGLLRRTFTLGTDKDLLELFDCSATREEELRGRKAWVMECAPKAGREPANAREKEAMSFRRTLWIDQQEYALLRSVHTVLSGKVNMKPGSTLTFDFAKVHDDAWMATSGVIDGKLQFLLVIQPAVRTEYTYSGFQKFDVESTITPDGEQ